MEERKGFLTPEQEQKLDELIVLKGISETLDGTAIRLSDNLLLEKLKAKIPVEQLPLVYQVIDEIFNSIVAITEK
jgi:hypothetical protein